MQQTTNTILMIRPTDFRMNEQTAVNNYYQKASENVLPETIKNKARLEFDSFVDILRNIGVNVIVFEAQDNVDTPDAVFPNNWISFHENGQIALYPMFAENRRLERREAVVEAIEAHGFIITEVIDYTEAEAEQVYLEGTGSLVLDRENKKAYCALSPRADEALCIEFCEDFDYFPVIFNAYQSVNGERKPIYHTNVMMCIGATFAVICLECIDDKSERKHVLQQLKEDKKEIIEISEAQVQHFAGNMLQVKGKDKNYLIMSQSACDALTAVQRKQLEKHTAIIAANLNTIETHGGGSARCMLAEIFLPKA